MDQLEQAKETLDYIDEKIEDIKNKKDIFSGLGVKTGEGAPTGGFRKIEALPESATGFGQLQIGELIEHISTFGLDRLTKAAVDIIQKESKAFPPDVIYARLNEIVLQVQKAVDVLDRVGDPTRLIKDLPLYQMEELTALRGIFTGQKLEKFRNLLRSGKTIGTYSEHETLGTLEREGAYKEAGAETIMFPQIKQVSEEGGIASQEPDVLKLLEDEEGKIHLYFKEAKKEVGAITTALAQHGLTKAALGENINIIKEEMEASGMSFEELLSKKRSKTHSIFEMMHGPEGTKRSARASMMLKSFLEQQVVFDEEEKEGLIHYDVELLQQMSPKARAIKEKQLGEMGFTLTERPISGRGAEVGKEFEKIIDTLEEVKDKLDETSGDNEENNTTVSTLLASLLGAVDEMQSYLESNQGTNA